MTALPLATNAVAAIATEADLKSFLLNQRDYLAGLFGTDGTAATARAALNVQTADNTKLPLTGGTMSGNLTFSNAAMYINHYDTDWGDTRYLHSNGGDMGFLNSAGNWALRSDNAGNAFATGAVTAGGEVYSHSGGHALSQKAGANSNYSWALVYTWAAKAGETLELAGNWGHGIYCGVPAIDNTVDLGNWGSGVITTRRGTVASCILVSGANVRNNIYIYKLTKGA